jgi:predicted nucleic acid-binding protein
VLIEAKRSGLIEEIRSRVDRLRQQGFRLSDADYRSALASAGEEP